MEKVEKAVAGLVKAIGSFISNADAIEDVVGALGVLSAVVVSGGRASQSWRPIQDALKLGELEKLAEICKQTAMAASVGSTTTWNGILCSTFYNAGSFPAFSKLLLFKVAPDWLACFTLAEQNTLFDAFFLLAPPNEAVMTLVPALVVEHGSKDEIDGQSTFLCIQVERLLAEILIKNLGVKKIAEDFGEVADHHTSRKGQHVYRESISQIAQLVSSIPDRARPGAPASLHSPSFYVSLVSQLLAVTKERWQSSLNMDLSSDGAFLFIGEVFGKLCRRGHADIVASEIVPGLAQFVSSHAPMVLQDDYAESNLPDDRFHPMTEPTYWHAIVLSMKDSHAIERFSEALLFALARSALSDWDAYYSLYCLFGNPLKSQASIRTLFTDRFLLWKAFPFCILKWILDFSVLCQPLACNPHPQQGIPQQERIVQKDVVRSLAEAWAESNYIRSASVEQQAYLTAAVGICVKAMSKEDISNTENLLKCLLEGISRRLESPILPVRRMAKQMALAFSTVINPDNPLLLDDEDSVEDLSNWDVFGYTKPNEPFTVHEPETKNIAEGGVFKEVKQSKKSVRKARNVFEVDDPDAMVDLTNLGTGSWLDEDSEGNEDESGSEASLQPYDMSDDEFDLDRAKFPSQLNSCATSLRKGDDPDVVIRALEVCERLIRLMPDELDSSAPDLAHALVHVRCSSAAVEGKEETAETRRHRALVALLVCSPLGTAAVLNKELYSAHVDVSQRLLILDVLSDAAQELANAEPNKAGVGTRLNVGPWKDVSYPAPGNSLIAWGQTFERELPPKHGQRELGKSRRWGNRSLQLRKENWEAGGSYTSRRNNFAPVAAAFMLPVMRDYDKRSHGVDFLGSDYIVLGRLIYMLGTCMECVAFQTDAAALGTALLDMLRSRAISKHPEPYVRRSVLFAASRVLIALHPSHIVTGLTAMDKPLTECLEWIREWALEVAANDPDADCSKMAVACLQVHSEVAFQASRSIESSRPSKTSLILPI